MTVYTCHHCTTLSPTAGRVLCPQCDRPDWAIPTEIADPAQALCSARNDAIHIAAIAMSRRRTLDKARTLLDESD